jgi:hypothetical protein
MVSMTEPRKTAADRKRQGIASQRSGTGPLLQRDYWAQIADCRLKPSEIGVLLAERFCELATDGLVRFCRTDHSQRPLEVGDELMVRIRFAGTFGVRVIARDACSLTLATLEGHPEAGRITFGAYRHDSGGVIFHIRSRARSSTLTQRAGFLTLGESMQTNAWTDLVESVARWTGSGVVDLIYEETREVDDDDDDDDGPTFVTEAD